MGLFEHWWEDTLQDWERQGFPKGVDVVDYFNHDIRPLTGGFNQTEAIVGQKIVVEETDDTIVTINGWGAKLRHWKHKAGTPEHIGFDLTDEDIWREKYRPHLLDLDTRRITDIETAKANYRKHMSGDKWCCYTNLLVVEMMRASMGDITMLESAYLNPKWIHDFCDVVTNMLVTHYEYVFSEVGVPDGMFFYEDMGYTYGAIMSPDLQRELIFPYHKRLVDFVHSYNIPIILHSCGKIRPFLRSIHESGVDCLQVLEAKAGQHVAEMAAAVDNRMAFMGNLNILAFETNDPPQLDKEIIPKLDAARENRIPYVFHSDHSIPKTVTPKTYEYALELFHKHGHY